MRRLACLLVLAGCWTGSSTPPPATTTATSTTAGGSAGSAVVVDAGTGVAIVDGGAAVAVVDAGPTVAVVDAGPTVAVVDAGPTVAVVDAGSVVASASCPASFGAAASAGTCTTFLQCTYPQGRCACSPPPWCGGAAPPPNYQQRLSWRCTPNVRPDGCPGDAPMTGQACTTPGKQCDYTCSCLMVATCAKGTWTMKRGPCKP